jgi:hypothetical protein
MGYVAVVLITVLMSFIVVSVGGFALQMTGMEATAARFQALSAFTGTGFTTAEAERVVRNKTRRQIITVLIVLGNVGLVAIIATLVVSFSQVTGYSWFFIRLVVIIAGVFVLYRLIIVSRIGQWIFSWVRKPLMRFVLKGSPDIEDVYDVGKGWSISLVTVKKGSNNIDRAIADVFAGEDIAVLAIDREGISVNKPSDEERIQEGDRLLVYGSGKALKRLTA